MPSNDFNLTLQFAGGWATSYGPHIEASPDQNGVLSLPFLTAADDCIFELDGGPHCIPGANKVNSVALEGGSPVNGVFDYWRTGTSGTATQHRIVYVGSKIKKDDGDGTFTDLFTGLGAGATPCFSVLEDLLVISTDGGDVPKSWNGSVAQNLAGSPPAFQFSEVHKNYMFAAGNPAYPSRLYYCVNLTPDDWVGAGSGTFDIDPSDGDEITGLASHKDNLFIFKGPHTGSIHRLAGSSATSTSDPFAISSFAKGVGTSSHAGIFRFGDDLGFMNINGTVRSLSATASFGDFEEGALSLAIDTWLRDHLTLSQLKRVQTVNWSEMGIVLFAVPADGSATNNYILMMDYRFGAPRWAPWPSLGSRGVSLGLVVDPSSSRRLVMGGGIDGYVRLFGQPNRSIDGTVALTPKITTPFMTFGTSLRMKTLANIGVGIAPRNNGTMTFAWTRDGNSQQSTTLTQGGTDVLGTSASSQFTLGTSALGGADFVTRYAEMEEGGEFRAIQFEITQSANEEDLEVHSIAASVTPGAISTENH